MSSESALTRSYSIKFWAGFLMSSLAVLVWSFMMYKGWVEQTPVNYSLLLVISLFWIRGIYRIVFRRDSTR